MSDKNLILGMPSDVYHAHPAVSKTLLDLAHRSPPLLEWYWNAPVDEEAAKAVDTGNAFEALLLEPERFERDYITAPDVDKRTTKGKNQWEEFLEDAGDRHVLKHDERRQLELMKDSVWAHPMAARILNAKHHIQASYFWTDSVTEIECRCRPDILCQDIPFVADLKVTGDIDRFARSAANFRMHVQDAFYSDGMENFYGERPWFVFIVVSSSRSAGRFPVHVFEFDIDSKEQGHQEYRQDLERYQEWLGSEHRVDLETLYLPAWARQQL